MKIKNREGYDLLGVGQTPARGGTIVYRNTANMSHLRNNSPSYKSKWKATSQVSPVQNKVDGISHANLLCIKWQYKKIIQ